MLKIEYNHDEKKPKFEFDIKDATIFEAEYVIAFLIDSMLKGCEGLTIKDLLEDIDVIREMVNKKGKIKNEK